MRGVDFCDIDASIRCSHTEQSVSKLLPKRSHFRGAPDGDARIRDITSLTSPGCQIELPGLVACTSISHPCRSLSEPCPPRDPIPKSSDDRARFPSITVDKWRPASWPRMIKCTRPGLCG